MIKPVDPRRSVYDEVLKAMRKRQRTRRTAATQLHDATAMRRRHDEADGMAELILMVKNMRDGGAP